MLGKLMKYEVKATARIFLPMYGALIILAILNKIFYSFNNFEDSANIYLQRFSEIPQALATMAYVLIIVAIFVVTMLVMIQRFYKNLLGDEGYLMFTLPVQPWMNITTKLVVSIMWSVLSGIVTAISIAILTTGSAMTEFLSLFPDVISMFDIELRSLFGIGLGHLMALIVIGFVVSMVAGILEIYASIAVGQLFNSHKLLASFGAYIVISMAMQAVSSVMMIVGMMMTGFNDMTSPRLFGAIMWGGIGLTLVFGIIFYVCTHIILTKRLNLE